MADIVTGSEQRIGKYVIQRELGRGGMGVVYLAKDTDLEREVALKRVQPSLACDARSLARFKKEARAVAALSHPNIVHINALTEADGVLLIEMPYMPAGSLRDSAYRNIPPAAVVGLLDKMLDALACCHESGIIHRDVKPSNILFDSDSNPKLSDFGAVALLENEWAQTQGERTLTLSFSGTPQYCCPEAWDGQPPTPRWDLYALGMVAREMLSDAATRPLATPLAHIRHLLESEEEPIRALVPTLSESFGTLIDQLTTRDPEARPESARAAQRQLRETPEFALATSADSRTLDLGSAVPRRRRPHRRWPTWLREAGRVLPWIAVLVLAAALSYVLFSVENPAAVRPSGMATAAPEPVHTQREVALNALPDAEEFAQLTREAVAGRSAVFTLRSARTPGAEAPFILRKQADDKAVAMGKLDHDLHYLQLARESGDGVWNVTGFAGSFTNGEVPVPLISRVYGTAEWRGNLEQPFWLALTYESELAQEEWQDSMFATPFESGMTDTEVVLSWENDRSAMPFLFRELSPRFPVPLAPFFFELLPAVEGARLTARVGMTTRDLAGAESLEAAKAIMGGAILARPSRAGAWLAADREHNRLRIVMGIPNASASPAAADVYLLPRYHIPVEKSPSLWVTFGSGSWRAFRVVGEERTPVLEGWTGAFQPLPGGQLVEVVLEASALYDGGLPVAGEWHRLNARVRIEEGAKSQELQWGWPETSAVRHGALVELAF